MTDSTTMPTLSTQLQDHIAIAPRIAVVASILIQVTGYSQSSQSERLGPSNRRSPLTISEIMYHPAATENDGPGEFIELYNSQPWAFPLDGYRIAGGVDYTFPPSSSIPAQGFLVVGQSPAALQSIHPLDRVLGPFSGRLSDGGETIRLLNPAGAVLLEVPFQDRAPWPKAADGNGYSLVLSHPSYHESDPRAWSSGRRIGGTPGQAEPTELTPESEAASDLFSTEETQTHEVIINEIMFNPITGNNADEYIELYNRSAHSWDLTGWELDGGIRFNFPDEIQIGPGEFLVIAKDLEHLRANHPQLTDRNSLGNYGGQLSNRGEAIRLRRPGTGENNDGPSDTNWILVDRVRYWDKTRQSQWADGGGSSLELLNPDSDNDAVQNWLDSDESSKSEWTPINVTSELIATGRGTARSFQVVHLGAGDCLVDDLSLQIPGEENQIPDGGFDTGEGRWVFQGNHVRSSVESTENPESDALLVRASGRGDTHSNRIRLNATRMRFPIPGDVSFQARVRWLRGHPEILFRFQNNYFEAAHAMTVPKNLGTPGLRNSRWSANTGPVVNQVRHTPLIPQAEEAVTVTAHVADPDGIQEVLLHTREDRSNEASTIPMRDDGIAPDGTALDGIYTAQFSPPSTGSVTAFRVEARDGHSTTATSFFPNADPTREALVRFGEPEAPDQFGNYRIWYTRSTLSDWTNSQRTPASNEPLPVTFVYNNERVFYDVRATYSGSFFNSPNYSSPTGSPCDYVLRFPSNERFLGATRVILSWPGLTGVPDTTLQREQLSYWLAGQMGLPFNYRRYVSVFVDGRRRGILMEDTQRPNGDMVRQWFPNDANGDLRKIQIRYEGNNSGTQAVSSQPASLALQTQSDGTKRKAAYRWNWAPQSDNQTANDFSTIYQLVDTVNHSDEQQYLSSLREEIDIEQWMRTFALEHLVGNWDSYGYGNGQNMYAYRPQNSGWKLMIWDLDIGLGSTIGEGPRTPLFKLGNPFFPAADGDTKTIGRMYQTPEIARAYYRAFDDAINGPFQEEQIEQIITAKFDALSQTSQRPRVASPRGILSFVRNRRQFVADQLAALPQEFQIDLPDDGITTSESRLRISGSAPIQVHHLTINNIPQKIDWTETTTWQLDFALSQSPQRLNIQAIDRHGAPIESFQAQRTVTYTGSTPLPAAQLRINEWMANNTATIADPADNDFEDWIELFNPGTSDIDLQGYSLTDDPARPAKWHFPAGATISAQGHLLIWADNEPEQTESSAALHASFRLNAEGEGIYLFAPDAALIDQVTFGPQGEDESVGRFPDGHSEIAPNGLSIATPGGSNQNTTPFRIERGSILSPNLFRLTWQSEPGRIYQIQQATQLGNEPWQAVGDSVVATESTTTVDLPREPNEPAAFYRIQDVPNEN